MKTATSLAAAFAAAAFPLAAAAAGHTHEHGVATLDIAVDPRRVSIALDTPLENLLGFERAPRSAAERQSADAAVARLKDGATLLRIDPAARCTLARVELRSAALGLGQAAPAGAKAAAPDHADLEAEYSFDCAGAAPGFVEVGLFAAFPRLQRVVVQTATAKGQARRTMTRPAARIELPR
jgi:hypothetical protein